MERKRKGKRRKTRHLIHTEPDPPPEEIRRLCLEIQASWDETTERARLGAPEYLAERWQPPTVCASEVRAR